MRIQAYILYALALGVVLSGCMSMPSYREAAERHHTYASGETAATAAEWQALIAEFQAVIDADANDPAADDAQYAIASCWLWRMTTGDPEAPQQAVEAFQKLIREYPNSPHLPHAHYWLGRSYVAMGDDYQAIRAYQLVESRYADSDILDDTQLELARVYERQVYITPAKTLYGTLVDSSTDPVIVDAARAALNSLALTAEREEPEPAIPTPQPAERPVEKAAPLQKPAPKPLERAAPLQKPAPKPETQPVQANPKPLVPKALTREFGLTAKTIVIDPGHGGKDPGASGQRAALQENAVVLSISKKLRDILTQRGYTVLMTRDTDRFIPLKSRTAFAQQNKADLFVSIHANGSTNPKAEGIETYYLDVTSTDEAAEALAARENADSGYSIQELETLLKGIIQESKSEDSKHLATAIQRAMIQATGAVDRGVKHARFVVLIGTSVPAVLVETGFISNPIEGRELTTPAYQQKLATAIAQGVETFLGKTPLANPVNSEITAKSRERN